MVKSVRFLCPANSWERNCEAWLGRPYPHMVRTYFEGVNEIFSPVVNTTSFCFLPAGGLVT
jgi:hypothetical protein